jgi:hypothetical protein
MCPYLTGVLCRGRGTVPATPHHVTHTYLARLGGGGAAIGIILAALIIALILERRGNK